MTSFVVTFEVSDLEIWEDGFRRRGPLFASQSVVGPVHYGVSPRDHTVFLSGKCTDIDALVAAIGSHEAATAMAEDRVKPGTFRLIVLDRVLEV